jgi:hypothetical protein
LSRADLDRLGVVVTSLHRQLFYSAAPPFPGQIKRALTPKDPVRFGILPARVEDWLAVRNALLEDPHAVPELSASPQS